MRKFLGIIAVLLALVMAGPASAETKPMFYGANIVFVDDIGRVLTIAAPTLSADGTVTFPTSGTLATTTGALTNPTITLGTDAQIYVANVSGVMVPVTASSAWTITNAGVATAATGYYNTTHITNGSIANVDIASDAAIALSKLAGCTDTQIAVAAGDGTLTCRTVSGDATLSNLGALTVAANSIESTMIVNEIANADISASAAIALSKLAGCTDTQIAVAAGDGTLTCRTVSGDATLSNLGALTVAANSIESTMIVNELTNVDIDAAAAIALSKLAACTDTQIVIGAASGTLTCQTMGTGMTITNAGVANLVDSTVGTLAANLNTVSLVLASGDDVNTVTIETGATILDVRPTAGDINGILNTATFTGGVMTITVNATLSADKTFSILTLRP
jgi:hypothetical protein